MTDDPAPDLHAHIIDKMYPAKLSAAAGAADDGSVEARGRTQRVGLGVARAQHRRHIKSEEVALSLRLGAQRGVAGNAFAERAREERIGRP